MLQLHRILFPTDFSPCAEGAFAHAAHLARRFDAELHVLNVAVPYEVETNNPMAHYALHREDDATWTDAGTGAPPEVPDVRMVHAQTRVVSPAMGILGYADEHDIDLIVMGTHGRRGIDRLFIGSVAEEVVRLATCPVFTVRAGGRPGTHPVESLGRILVPVDFSASSERALLYAKELARSYDARLALMHVIQEVVLPAAYGVEPASLAVPEVVERARQGLADLADRLPGARVPFDVHVFVGTPAHDIVAFAGEIDADLVVIATHGLTGLRRLFLGSVTEKVVRSSPCPVFTVKSYGKTLLPADLHAEAGEA